MTEIYINDANVLIDLCNLDIVEEFLALDYQLCTTDFIIAELDEEQALKFKDNLKIYTSDANALLEINTLFTQHNGLSFEDCSVWYFAHKMSGILLTSDMALRKKAAKGGVNVKGILHLFEEMKNQKCMPLAKCISKLEALKIENPWAPMILIDELIVKFKNDI